MRKTFHKSASKTVMQFNFHNDDISFEKLKRIEKEESKKNRIKYATINPACLTVTHKDTTIRNPKKYSQIDKKLINITHKDTTIRNPKKYSNID